MKYCFVVILYFSFMIDLSAQEASDFFEKIQVEIGYVNLSNHLNDNNYYNFKYRGAPDRGEASLGGLNLKFTVPTKNKNIDLIFGSMFLKGNDNLSSTSWVPGNTNSSDYTANGGGVYFGISPKLKGKTVGLTSDFAIGIFSFKEYLGIFNNKQEPYVDEYEKNASNGLGGMASVGGYVKLGKFGINPTVNAIYSGGSNTSFLFYGFVFPISYQF